MAINTNIQNLINSNKKMSNTDVDNLFYYFYGRSATSAEKSHWGGEKKTSSDLSGKLEPNAEQFKTAGYYKDIISQPQQTGDPYKDKKKEKEKEKEEEELPQLPPELSQKLYDATGSIKPSKQDLEDWQYNPQLFEQKLDTEIEKKTQEEEKKVKEEEDKVREEEGKVREEEDKVKEAEAGQYQDYLGQAFFRGEDALVKFSEDPDGPGPLSASTVWLVNQRDKTFRPFLSEESFNNYFEEDIATVTEKGGIKTIPMSFFDSGNVFSDFKMMKDTEGIKDDGTFPTAGIDGGKIRSLYGQTKDENANRHFLKMVIGSQDDPNSGLLGLFSDDISDKIIEDVTNDLTTIGLYVSALAYGGYTPADIYRDLKRKQLISEGRDDLKDTTVISLDQSASEFFKTPEGQAIRSNPDLSPPQSLRGIDTGLLDNVAFNLPPELYEVLVPPFDPNSETGKAEMEKIKTAYYDVLLQQLEAVNDREKVIADYSYKLFKDELAKEYDIKLSDNSSEAWAQIKSVEEGFSRRGLSGSGLADEAMDMYLKDVRKVDERGRVERLSKEEEEKRQYFLRDASPEEISQLSEEDKVRYGLKPSQETLDWFSEDNLKKLYPNLSDEEIKNYKTSIIDPQGNYRSQLYQTYFINRYGLEQSKKTFQLGEVQYDPVSGRVIGGQGALYKKALEEEEAYRPFEKAGAFEKPFTSPEAGTPTTQPTPLSFDQYQAQKKESVTNQIGISPIETENAQYITEAPSTGQKQFYRIGQDIFESGTNRRIGETEWNKDWTGRASEVPDPSSGLIGSSRKIPKKGDVTNQIGINPIGNENAQYITDDYSSSRKIPKKGDVTNQIGINPIETKNAQYITETPSWTAPTADYSKISFAETQNADWKKNWLDVQQQGTKDQPGSFLYGIKRDQPREQAQLGAFGKQYGKMPSQQADWDKLHRSTYKFR